MADAEYGEGYFVGMREEFRRLKVNEFSSIIAEFAPYSLALWCHLDWLDYIDIVRGKVHPKIDSPYAVLFYQIMRGAHEHQIEINRRINLGFQRVDFIFDEQGLAGPKAVQWYAALVDKLPQPYKLMAGATPIFRHDKYLPALQSADMLAWHVHRSLENPDEQRQVFDTITYGLTGQLSISRDTLSEFVELTKRIDVVELEKAR